MSPRLRVAVVARAVWPLHGQGGLERSVHDLVRHLALRDVAVTLITPPPTIAASDLVEAFDSSLIKLSHVPYVTFPLANRRGTTVLDRSTSYPAYGLRAGRAALALVLQGAVDIVHGFGASVLGYALARHRASAPLVLNPQGLEEFGATGPGLTPLKDLGYWPLRRAVLRCARSADRIIVTDRALESTVARHLQPRAGQMVVIPNGIDLPAAVALASPEDGRRLRQVFEIASETRVVLSVGRLEYNKGFDVLARALARASAEGQPLRSVSWQWVIVGDGPFRRDLEGVIATLGLESHVLFAGRASDRDLHAWYEAATVFAHPTRYEGSSIVTLEAMAHERAIVATRAGGLPDKVRPGKNGWLVEPEDPAPLASAIIAALTSSDETLAAMGAHSRRIVESEFAWSALVDRQIELYRALIAGRD